MHLSQFSDPQMHLWNIAMFQVDKKVVNWLLDNKVMA